MTQQYTPAQLEAWAGLGPWSYRSQEHDDWGVVRSGKYFVCQAKDFRNMDFDTIIQFRKERRDPHEIPARLIAAGPDLARLVLEKEKEIARLKAAAADLVSLCSADIKMNGTTYQPMPDRSAFTKAVERMIELINKDRQAMKETSDE